MLVASWTVSQTVYAKPSILEAAAVLCFVFRLIEKSMKYPTCSGLDRVAGWSSYSYCLCLTPLSDGGVIREASNGAGFAEQSYGSEFDQLCGRRLLELPHSFSGVPCSGVIGWTFDWSTVVRG